MIDIVFNCPKCNKRPSLQSYNYNNKSDIIYECCGNSIIGLNNWNEHCMLKSTVLKHEKEILEMQTIIDLLLTNECPYCDDINNHTSDCIIGRCLKYKPIFSNLS